MNQDFVQLVRDWAVARNLILGSAGLYQYTKLVEELGEVTMELNRNYPKGGVDTEVALMRELGDMMVVLIIMESQHDGLELDWSGLGTVRSGINDGTDWSRFTPRTDARQRAHLIIDLTAVTNQIGSEMYFMDATYAYKFGELMPISHHTKAVFQNFVDAMVGVCLTLDISAEECLSMAYNKIKDRKGTMKDGVFFKEADL